MDKDYTQNEGLGDLEVGEIGQIASGLPAITDTVKHTFGEMDAMQGTFALLLKSALLSASAEIIILPMH